MLDFLAGDVVEKIGKVADSLFTSDKERLEKENEKIKAEIDYKKSEIDLLKNEQDNISKRWEADTHGNFLTKSVRPLTLIYMIVILTIMAFLDGNVGKFSINPAYINLFQNLAVMVFVAFFGGKTIERLKNKG